MLDGSLPEWEHSKAVRPASGIIDPDRGLASEEKE